MTVMIDKISLAEIQKKAAKQRAEIESEIQEIVDMGDNATHRELRYKRTLEMVLAPQT